MNRESVLSFAKGIFNDLHPLNENVYAGELKVNSQKPAGIYYFDFSNDIPFNPIEKFNEYQDKILADEYYKHSGTLQWNLYLLLLQDSIAPEIKSEIEKNDKYARKYFFNEDEFKDFFKLKSSDTAVKSDIVLKWKESLNAADLQEVYSKASYTSVVDNFLNNRTIKLKSTSSSNTEEKVVNFDVINKIVLNNNYREYPKERTFNFGKVNLVKGTNGVGKTSLFEAIELLVCGKTLRNWSRKEEDNCIEGLVDNSAKITMCTPSQNERYRNRDLYWYGNSYAKDNECYTPFNKFNFFNTDAAHNFSNSSTEEEVKSALTKIVLGEEYSYLTERISGFHGRFKPHYNSLVAENERANSQIKKSTEIINRHKSSGSIQAFKDTVLNDLKKLRFIKTDYDLETSYTLIEEAANNLKVYFARLSQYPFATTLEKINTYAESLAKQKTIFADFEQKYREKVKEIDVLEDDSRKLQTRVDLLSQAIPYFDDPELFNIVGFQNRLSSLNKTIEKTEAVNRIFQEYNFSLLDVKLTVNEHLTKQNGDLKTLNTQLIDVEKQLKGQFEQFSKLESVIKQIKLFGSEFTMLKPDATICPLCQTTYSNEELLQRIFDIADQLPSNSATSIEDIHGKQQKIKAAISELEITLRGLYSLKGLLEKNSFTCTTNSKISEINDEVLVLQSNLNEKISQKRELLDFETKIKRLNISESGFVSLREKLISMLGEKFVLAFESKLIFQNESSDIISRIEKNSEAIRKLQTSKSELSHNIKTELKLTIEENYTLSTFQKELAAKESNIESVMIGIKNIQTIIILSESNKFQELDLANSALLNNLNSLKAEYQNQIELKNAEKDKKSAEISVEGNKVKFERVSTAYATLSSLIQQNGSEELTTFFNENLLEITDIFRTIHSPREFDAIIFESNTLFLLKNGVKRKITEISTGQRAALALSLFISLNRKLKKGPNIIMFDDPVANIDDLNALSFLDFLRFFVLKEGKQIFFATANFRLASLIEKKFEFLENDFKSWELKR